MINLLLVFLFLFSPLLFVLYYLWEVLGVAWTSVAAIATLFTALAVLLATIAAFRGIRVTRDAVEATRKAAEGQLFMQMSTAYSSEEMLRGMRKLIGFKKKYKEDYEIEFGKKLRGNSPEGMDWNAARRRFVHWRHAVHQLEKHNFISQNLFDDLWNEGKQDFYEEYVLPLENEVKKEIEERKKERKDATNEKTGEKTE